VRGSINGTRGGLVTLLLEASLIVPAQLSDGRPLNKFYFLFADMNVSLVLLTTHMRFVKLPRRSHLWLVSRTLPFLTRASGARRDWTARKKIGMANNALKRSAQEKSAVVGDGGCRLC
jgi:hypothetical protein